MLPGWHMWEPGRWRKGNMHVEKFGSQWEAMIAPGGNYAFLQTIGPYRTATKAMREAEKANRK